MARPVGIALVGAGYALHTQLPAFRLVPDARVRVLVGRDPERTRALARQHGIPVATERLERALEDPDVHLVCIATPPDLHRAMAEAALAAGKHVLCEKPLALTAGEAMSMCRAARAAGRLALVDHQLRFAPGLVKMRRLIQDGYAGMPLHVQVSMLGSRGLDAARPHTWWHEAARGGGVLGALGSHAIDWLGWTFGPVRAASGTLRTFVAERAVAGELRPRRVDSDDYAAFWLELGRGRPVRAAAVLSVVAHGGGGTRLEVHGTEGALRWDEDGRLWGNRWEAGSAGRAGAPLEDLSDAGTLPTGHQKLLPDSAWARAFAHLARVLVPAVAEGGDVAGAATFEDGLAVQRVLDVLRAQEPSAWVQVDDARP